MQARLARYHLRMSTPAPIRRLSPEAYLAWETEQIDRHELVDGLPYAMAGAGRLHEEVAGAVFALLWEHLEGKACRAYKGDRKLQVGTDFFYPDIVVTCDPVDRRADGAIRAPVAIIEVLSRPTAAYDRGEKLQRYMTLATPEVYLIADPESRQVERYDRSDGWTRRTLPSTDPIVIQAIDFTCDQQRIFAAVD
jgi:Uma2 family endonuclease